ncbi:MAG: aminotransferase class V-fold PLP-dependent enzyme [Candidatus Thermoplasmatota archaeon]|nr:aminotransferase class V-fold PLP-dependent enzyme [Candidatus Thermoplasmatota archaeon]
MDLEAYRDEFPIFRTKSYLNTCSLGPLSTRVQDAIMRFTGDWNELGASAWHERWMDAIDALAAKYAGLIGAAREEIALAPNVSSALSIVASALSYRDRDRVVTTDLDFPTIPYQWMVRPGVEVDLISGPDTVTMPTSAFEETVSERTVAVATTHVFFATGFIQDVTEIARIAHRMGALCIVDGYHATGQLPVDVPSLGVDVYISGSLKWLLGGPGLAFLYVRRDLLSQLTPTFTGWFGNTYQFEFDPRRFAFREDARRFEVGTPANAAVFAADAGLDIIMEVGPDRIRERTLALADDLIERAEDAGLDVRAPPPGSRTGIVMIEHPDPSKAVSYLADHGVIIDSRGTRVRLSPYFYNSFEENQQAVGLLRDTC